MSLRSHAVSKVIMSNVLCPTAFTTRIPSIRLTSRNGNNYMQAIGQLTGHPNVFIRVATLNQPDLTGRDFTKSSVQFIFTNRRQELRDLPDNFSYRFVRPFGENPEVLLNKINEALKNMGIENVKKNPRLLLESIQLLMSLATPSPRYQLHATHDFFIANKATREALDKALTDIEKNWP